MRQCVNITAGNSAFFSSALSILPERLQTESKFVPSSVDKNACKDSTRFVADKRSSTRHVLKQR